MLVLGERKGDVYAWPELERWGGIIGGRGGELNGTLKGTVA